MPLPEPCERLWPSQLPSKCPDGLRLPLCGRGGGSTSCLGTHRRGTDLPWDPSPRRAAFRMSLAALAFDSLVSKNLGSQWGEKEFRTGPGPGPSLEEGKWIDPQLPASSGWRAPSSRSTSALAPVFAFLIQDRM